MWINNPYGYNRESEITSDPLPSSDSLWLSHLRTTKINTTFPVLKCHAIHGPCWFQEELTIRGPQEGMVGVYGLEEGMGIVTVQGSPYKAQAGWEKGDKEDCWVVGSGTCQGSVNNVMVSLNNCTKHNDLQRGSKIHNDIAKSSLIENNIFVANALLNMYGKCGALAKAQEVFDNLPVHDTVSWNTLIAGYAQQGCGELALDCFERMQLEGLSPNAVTFVSILKACCSIGDLDKTEEVHDLVVRNGLLKSSIHVATVLVDTYAKYGLLGKAQEVFDELQERDVVLWTALISGYAQQGHGERALRCFEEMQNDGFGPSTVTFASVLKACGSIGAASKGEESHAKIIKECLLERSVIVGNALIDMYIKCSLLEKAQNVFEELPLQDVVSWTTLIAGYVEYGHDEAAWKVYERMQRRGFHPDAATYVSILKACVSMELKEKGQEVHSEIISKGLLKNMQVATGLIDMYGKLGMVKKARRVFDGLQFRDVVSWNALVSGYAQHDHVEEALGCFEVMQLEGFCPDAVTFACLLKACSRKEDASQGQELHADIVRIGLWEEEIVVSTALLGMYATCGMLAEAEETFHKLLEHDVAAWNALINGYAHVEFPEKALNCFDRMQCWGFFPDKVTLASTLKACGSIGAADKGQEIHALIVGDGVMEEEASIGAALVDMYAKCGLLREAEDVLEELHLQDAPSWHALVAGYALHEQCEEALNLFNKMQHFQPAAFPDAETCGLILKSCGRIGPSHMGQELHAGLVKVGLVDKDIAVGTALMTMYANCCMLAETVDVFDRLRVNDVVSWNVLMAGYAQLGQNEVVMKAFDEMVEEGKEPDSVTFILVLSLCSHAGLLDKGQEYFKVLNKSYGRVANIEHYICMVDLFSRAGMLGLAIAIIEEIPFFCNNITLWNRLLTACQKWESLYVGKWAFNLACQVDEDNAAAFVYMSNICAAGF